MKLFAGIVLLVIGIGLGYGLYMWAAGYAEAIKCEITLGKPATTIARGENETIDVTVTYIMGVRENVELQASGYPTGVVVDFTPARDVPTFYSDMTIIVTAAAETGDYPLTILARDAKGGEAASVRFDLTIT
jgi:hypothetical protein